MNSLRTDWKCDFSPNDSVNKSSPYAQNPTLRSATFLQFFSQFLEKGLWISFPFALVVYINLIKLWYEVILRSLTIPLIKADAFPACHSDRLMTLLPLLMLIGPAHTHVSSPSQGHAALVNSKIKSEHDVQP